MITFSSDYVDNVRQIYNYLDNNFKSVPLAVKQLVMCQAVLESNLFRHPSGLALKAKNLFGIKAVKADTPYISFETREYVDGNFIFVDQRFRRYDSYEESIAHIISLYYKPRYARVLAAKSFAEAAKATYLCGYATDPRYPQKLIGVYNDIVTKLHLI